jgi:hypothetical protein
MNSQTIVKESAPYDLNPATCSDAYGPEHQARISTTTARALCGMYPLPKPGYETVCAVAGSARLYVQNLGGYFYVASSSVSVAHWPMVFRVTLRRFGRPVCRLTPCRIEVPAPRNGRPGYRWTTGYLVDGTYPPVMRREAYQAARLLHGERVKVVIDKAA